jgi:ABC-type glycerol-3-phosphate transport system permease component
VSAVFSRRRAVGRSGLVLVLLLVALATLVPVAWMLLTSFKPEQAIYEVPPRWLPSRWTLEHYGALFTRWGFGAMTINSLIVASGAVLVSTLLGALAAYGFARHPYRGSGTLLALLLLTRMVTPAALVVPLYLLMQTLDLLNTLTSIVIGITILNLPFVIWMLKPFFESVPREVEEAAAIDGLSLARVFWQIALPMAAPGLVTVLLFSFIGAWVDLLFGMSFATTPEAMPLTVGLLQMQTGYKIYWGPLMAGGVYLTLPTFLLAFALQRYLLRGLRLGY